MPQVPVLGEPAWSIPISKDDRRWKEQRCFHLRSPFYGNSGLSMVVTLLAPREDQSPSKQSTISQSWLSFVCFPIQVGKIGSSLFAWRCCFCKDSVFKVGDYFHSLLGKPSSLRSYHEECLLLEDFFWKKSLFAFIYATLWKGVGMKGTEKRNTDIHSPRVVRKASSWLSQRSVGETCYCTLVL